MFVREFGFMVVEYEPERAWIVVGSRRLTVELEDGQDFLEWARQHWPPPRFKVEPEPAELPPWDASRG